jgi:hypothetical protein
MGKFFVTLFAFTPALETDVMFLWIDRFRHTANFKLTSF